MKTTPTREQQAPLSSHRGALAILAAAGLLVATTSSIAAQTAPPPPAEQPAVSQTAPPPKPQEGVLGAEQRAASTGAGLTTTAPVIPAGAPATGDGSTRPSTPWWPLAAVGALGAGWAFGRRLLTRQHY